MGRNTAKRPAFTSIQVKQLQTALRRYEKTGAKQRSCQIRKLLRDYVNFALLTGCRTGTELSTLKWKDIDTFTNKGKEYIAVTVDGKTGEREVITSTRLQRYLDRLNRRNRSKSEYVFVLPDGTRPKDLHGAFETLLKSIALHTNKQGKKFSLYSLRHTYATKKLLEGTPMHLLARQMGTSTAMLEAHYSKVTSRMSANLFG